MRKATLALVTWIWLIAPGDGRAEPRGLLGYFFPPKADCTSSTTCGSCTTAVQVVATTPCDAGTPCTWRKPSVPAARTWRPWPGLTAAKTCPACTSAKLDPHGQIVQCAHADKMCQPAAKVEPRGQILPVQCTQADKICQPAAKVEPHGQILQVPCCQTDKICQPAAKVELHGQILQVPCCQTDKICQPAVRPDERGLMATMQSHHAEKMCQPAVKPERHGLIPQAQCHHAEKMCQPDQHGLLAQAYQARVDEERKACKAKKRANFIDWLCYSPERAPCEKKHECCCTPPLYLFFLCTSETGCCGTSATGCCGCGR